MRYRSRPERWLTRPILERIRCSRDGAPDLGAEMANLLNEIVAKDFGGGWFAGAFRLWNIVRCTKRQRFEADLRVAAGVGRSHVGDQDGFLCHAPKQRGKDVLVLQLDIEPGDIRGDP